MIKIDIISGFLGAGKTTLIKHLIKNSRIDEKIVIIENEFGEENIDALELSELQVSIKEITYGCICCSLTTDLIVVIRNLIKNGNIDRIIIEPTGVAMLSTVLSTLNNINNENVKLNFVLTVLDITELENHAGAFGKFFADQIISTNMIVLSKFQQANNPDIEFARYYIKEINPNAIIIEENWKELSFSFFKKKVKTNANGKELQRQVLLNHISLNDGFEALYVRPKEKYTKERIIQICKNFCDNANGELIRIKGYIKTSNEELLKLDYVLGKLTLEPSKNTKKTSLNIIGKNLAKFELNSIFQ